MKRTSEAAPHPRNFPVTALLIIACVLLAYPEVLMGRKAIAWDSYDYFYPKFLYFVDSLKSGYFPLWNPYEMSGVPMWPWNGGLLNPVNLVFVLLSLIFDPDYIFQLMLLVPVAMGGLGAYSLFRSMRYEALVQAFGGIAFSFTMFGPILGQYSVAYAIAFIPWLFYIAVKIVDSKGEIGPFNICLYSLAVAAFVVTAYPVMIFLVGSAALFYCAFRFFTEVKPDRARFGKGVVKTLFIVLVLAGAVSSVAVFPMLENRAFTSAQLKGDFVSPDPRLRVSMARGAWTQGYEPTISNYLALAKGNVLWHSGFTLVMFFLLISAFFRFFKDVSIPFFVFLALVFMSYVKGRSGLTYEFVFNTVPLFWNNRYPVFGLSLVKFLLMLVSIGQINYLCKLVDARDEIGINREKRRSLILGCIAIVIIPLAFYKPFYWPFSASILILSVFVYFYLRGKISAPLLLGVMVMGLVGTHYAYLGSCCSIVNPEERRMSREREVNIEYRSNSRVLSKSKDYVYNDRSWVFSKVPINQGYYMADIPAYWYLKNSDFLGKLFYLSGKIKMQDQAVSRANFKTDNGYMDALVSQVLVSSGIASIVDRIPDGPALDPKVHLSGVISNVNLKPNEFSASVEVKSPALLVLTDKYYPGWAVYVDGARRSIVRVNICFKGVYLEAGKHEVKFVFRPRSFYFGLAVTVISLVVMGALCFYRRKKDFDEVES